MTIIDDETIDDYAWERRQERRLAAHPDCRDPAHPGCEYCADRDDDDDEGKDE